MTPGLDETLDDGGWYSNDAATFGDRLAAAREAVGMNAEELADRLGVKAKTIHAWENDLAEPRANKLQMLAGLLNVSLVWLLSGEGEGLGEPADERDLPHDLHGVLTEIRQVKVDMQKTSQRLSQLEKRLKTMMSGGA